MSKKPEEKIPFRELSSRQQTETANPELTPEMVKKLEKLMEFFDQYGIDYDKFTPEHLSFIQGKKAYPNYDQYMYLPGQHDIKKWLMTVKNIHYKNKAGLSFKEAVRQSTENWKKMEVYDFLNWLKFYEEGAQMKYKFAQVWYENGQPGYFLHIKPDAQPVQQSAPAVDDNAINDAREEANRNEEKRNTIEKQRQKIIGRLDSAEKLLRSPEGQQFAGPELENLMEAIYSLKKKVQLVNKLSVSTRLYEDMIVREANVLKRNGFIKAAEVLYSVAQTPAASAESAVGQKSGGIVPANPAPPADPSGAGQSGTMSGLPSTIPGTPNINTPVDGDQNKDQPPAAAVMQGAVAPSAETAQSTPAVMPQEPPQPAGIKEFIENMNKGNQTDDNLEVEDQEDRLLVTEAQTTPPPTNLPPAVLEDVPLTDTPPPSRGNPADLPPPTTTPKEEEPLEVSEKDLTATQEDEVVPPTSGINDKMDRLMQNVTLGDVVAELEDLSKTYKTREQPRRLNFVDMMLDSLGLASMFPSLAEAQNKALEANNYISSRVDDILAKLRGAMASQEKETVTPPPERPEVAGVKNKLQSDQDKETKRKQMRKEQETIEGGKETPQVEMGDLAVPAAAPRPPTTPPPLG